MNGWIYDYLFEYRYTRKEQCDTLQLSVSTAERNRDDNFIMASEDAVICQKEEFFQQHICCNVRVKCSSDKIFSLEFCKIPQEVLDKIYK